MFRVYVKCNMCLSPLLDRIYVKSWCPRKLGQAIAQPNENLLDFGIHNLCSSEFARS